MADESAVPVAALPAIPVVLRHVATWLESHPQVVPYEVALCDLNYGLGPARIVVFPQTAEKMADLARSIGGRWEKDHGSQMFGLRREVCAGLAVELMCHREAVCERVQTGTRTVEVPDPELVADIPVVTVDEPVYEWRCEPILAAVSGEAPSGDGGS